MHLPIPPGIDPEFMRFVDKSTPHLNMDLVNGLAHIHMQESLRYLNTIWESAAVSFPPQVTYEGFRVCTPEEMYRLSFKSGNSKRKKRQGAAGKGSSEKQYEVAKTNFYLVEYFIHFEGQPLNMKTILAVPHVRINSELLISDTEWYISPVLADKVISIGSEHIFVRLLRDRLTFSRLPSGYPVMCNGVRESVGLVVSQIYHQKTGAGEPKPATNAKSSMSHYLFCKHGFQGALKKYARCEVIVGDNLSEKDYPPDQWMLYRTSGVAPRMQGSRRRVFTYVAPTICVAVPINQHNERARVMIAALFYVADYFPAFIRPEYVHDPRTWITPMGYILLTDNMNRGKLEEQMMDHIDSLDEYADPIVIANMEKIGLKINDIYDFFATVAENFGKWLSNSQDKINSMYDKELSVLYFVYFDVIKAIFWMNFKLKTASKKNLTRNDVEAIVKECIKFGLMYGLTKRHGEVSTKSYSGDNRAFKMTADLVPQTSTGQRTKGKGSDRGAIHDPSKKRHVSVGEFAAMACMTKSDPTGRSRINHWALLDESKTMLVRNPKFSPMLDTITQMLTIKKLPADESSADFETEKPS